ncbi:MAG: YihY/virulence factor BrkB family protein [Candidatus Altiarchaeota archaeon]|nr:YihY/virulence factor BrkB family protein [Candidatus Altiarchaeota archaeon]
MWLREFPGILKRAFKEWQKDNASLLAAALAYYALFSLSPLVILVVVLAGLILGPEAASGDIVEQVKDFVTPELAKTIQGLVQNVSNPANSLVATVIASVVVFAGATGVFLQTRRALDIIWDVKPQKGGTVLNAVKSYSLSFIVILIVGSLLLLSLVLSALISSAAKYLRDVLPFNVGLLHAINPVVSFIILTLLFAFTFKTLVRVKLVWSDVFTGAALTAVLFIIGNLLIEIYIGMGTVGSVYGAASSIVVIIFWIYYSAQMFLFGAEFIKVYARMHGSYRIRT